MEGLLGKIVKDMERVPERKLDLKFEEVPASYAGEKALGSLTKQERQMFCLYRDVLLKIDALLTKDRSAHEGVYDMLLGEAEHRIVHPLDSEALLLYYLIFSSVRHRLSAGVQNIAVCRGGKIVEVQRERMEGLDSIMQAVLERNPQVKKTVH